MNWLQFLLASRRWSDAPDPIAARRAAAVLRAALEAEKPSESNRFEERRHQKDNLQSLFLIARSESPFGQPALDFAEKLAGNKLACRG